MALARREGLYASTITKWKEWRERMQGQNAPWSSPEKPESYESLRGRLRKAERESRRLALKLKRAEGLLDLQKKASELLESLNQADESNENT
jgi:predicted nuclease with TOPRIM domain